LPGGDTSVKYVTKRDSPDAKGIAWEMKEFRASPSFSSSKCSERKYKRSRAAQTLAMLSHRSSPPRISRFFCITRYFFAIPKPEPRINPSLELSPMTASRYSASLERDREAPRRRPKLLCRATELELNCHPFTFIARVSEQPLRHEIHSFHPEVMIYIYI